ncbi:MAG: hypothetical protein Tsb0021_12720 [Chlamydiales bacterium]
MSNSIGPIDPSSPLDVPSIQEQAPGSQVQSLDRFIDGRPPTLEDIRGGASVTIPPTQISIEDYLAAIQENRRALSEVLHEIQQTDPRAEQEFHLLGVLIADERRNLGIAGLFAAVEASQINQDRLRQATDRLNQATTELFNARNQFAVERNELAARRIWDGVNRAAQSVIEAYNSGENYSSAAIAYNFTIAIYNQEVGNYNEGRQRYVNAINNYNAAVLNYVSEINRKNSEIFQINQTREASGQALLPYQLTPSQFLNPGFDFNPDSPSVPVSAINLFTPSDANIGGILPTASPIPASRPATLPNVGVPNLSNSIPFPSVPNVSPPPPLQSSDPGGQNGSLIQINIFEIFRFLFQLLFGQRELTSFVDNNVTFQIEDILRSSRVGVLAAGEEEEDTAETQSTGAGASTTALISSGSLESSIINVAAENLIQETLEQVSFRGETTIPRNLSDRVQDLLSSVFFQASILTTAPATSIVLSLSSSQLDRNFVNGLAASLGLSSQLVTVTSAETLRNLVNAITQDSGLDPETQELITNQLVNTVATSILTINASQLGDAIGAPELLVQLLGLTVAQELPADPEILNQIALAATEQLTEEQLISLQTNLENELTTLFINEGIEQELAQQLAAEFINNVFLAGAPAPIVENPAISPALQAQINDLAIQTTLIGIINERFAESVREVGEDLERRALFRQLYSDQLIAQGLLPNRAGEIAERVTNDLAEGIPLTEIFNNVRRYADEGENISAIASAAAFAIVHAEVEKRLLAQLGIGPEARLLTSQIIGNITESTNVIRESVRDLNEELDREGLVNFSSAYYRIHARATEPDVFLRELLSPARLFAGLTHEIGPSQVIGPGDSGGHPEVSFRA